MSKTHYYSRIVFELGEDPREMVAIDFTRHNDYRGPWDRLKGDSVDKQEEEQTQQFDQSLMSIFQSQYATQSSQLSYLQGKMQPIINAGGTGYTPEQLATQRNSATTANTEDYQQAQDALNNQVSQNSGGSKLVGVSGATTEADAALLNASAKNQSQTQDQITTNNANLQQQNYWNAINALNGVATEENPLGYAGASNSAGSTVGGLSTAFTQSNQSQLLGALGGAVGGIAGGLGTAIGGPSGAGSIGALFA